MVVVRGGERMSRGGRALGLRGLEVQGPWERWKLRILGVSRSLPSWTRGEPSRGLSRGVTRSDLDFKTVHPGVRAAESQREGERPFCAFVAWAWRLRGWSVRTAPGAVCPFAALQALTWHLAGPPVIAGGCLSVRRDAAMPSGRRPFPEAPAASAALSPQLLVSRTSALTAAGRCGVEAGTLAFSSSLLPTGADPGLRWLLIFQTVHARPVPRCSGVFSLHSGIEVFPPPRAKPGVAVWVSCWTVADLSLL